MPASRSSGSRPTSPPIARRTEAPLAILVDEIASPLGRIVIAARDGRLCALEFDRGRVRRAMARRYPRARPRPSHDPFGISSRICAYLAGDLTALDQIAVDTGGTPFQRRVWRALRRIPAGRAEGFGALARGPRPGSAGRAVGGAHGGDPVP